VVEEVRAKDDDITGELMIRKILTFCCLFLHFSRLSSEGVRSGLQNLGYTEWGLHHRQQHFHPVSTCFFTSSDFVILGRDWMGKLGDRQQGLQRGRYPQADLAQNEFFCIPNSKVLEVNMDLQVPISPSRAVLFFL
jgi:hypothetical protein